METEVKVDVRQEDGLGRMVLAKASATAPTSLAEAVQLVVNSVDDAHLIRIAPRGSGLAFQPRSMLAIATSSYARNIFGSAQIAQSLRRDLLFSELCNHELPDADAIMRFRTLNHDVIKQCLSAALSFLAEEKIRQGMVTKVDEKHFSEEAERRLTVAAFIDNSRPGLD